MAAIFRALAVDFDGTISRHGRRPEPHVLAALARTRAGGCRIVLVTGRILSELRADFPDVADHVDAIVAENGCVVATDGQERLLTQPVDRALADRLTRLGVSARTGGALLACDGRHAVTVLEQIRSLGLDAQIVTNRGALMVLPAGITKGTGLYQALGDLGVSHHSTIGVGDAENDHALLDLCEVGAAVGNAVPALRRHADLVLPGRDGDAVTHLLDGPVMSGERVVHPSRWRLTLGTAPGGEPVSLPASQLNLLICGDTGSGKSYTAGLVAERLMGLGYCVLVVDPEGDHRELVRLRGTQPVDAADGLPSPERLVQRFRHRFSSVVLDLSVLDPQDRRAYLDALAPEVARSRQETGLPHWVVIDEAHAAPPSLVRGDVGEDSRFRGQCLATFRPHDLDDGILSELDGVIALGGPGPLPDEVVDICRRVSRLEEAVIRHLAGARGPHDPLLALDPALGPSAPVRQAARVTPQVRHEHKYGATRTDPQRWFYFRDRDDRVVDVAGNMTDLRSVLAGADDDVLRHHASGRDLSAWVGAVFQDPVLSAQLGETERLLDEGAIDPGEARVRMLAAVTRRYPP